MRRPSFSVLVGSLSLLALAGCRRDEIRTYAVKKDPASVTASSPSPAMPGPAAPSADAPAQDAMRNTAVPTASGPGLVWDAPAGWTAGPARPMRKATLLIPGEAGGPSSELAVTAFPGDVGGNLANVNRWRQQLGLPPIAQSELGSALQHIDVGPLHIDVVELAGPATPPAVPQRVLGAIVPHAGSTWFFKLTGPDPLVARQREAFFAFVRTIRPQG